MVRKTEMEEKSKGPNRVWMNAAYHLNARKFKNFDYNYEHYTNETLEEDGVFPRSVAEGQGFWNRLVTSEGFV